MISTTITRSSNISQIDYDESSATLIIHFKQGGIYAYYNVPLGIYDSFLHAGSLGKYFHANIKGQYESKRL